MHFGHLLKDVEDPVVAERFVHFVVVVVMSMFSLSLAISLSL